MMTSPQTVLKTLTDKSQQQPDNIISLLNKQIDQLRKKLKTYSSKEKNLYDLMGHEAVTGDYVLESVEKLRQERESRNATIQQIADATQIRLDYLEALERNEFHALPGPAFGISG